MTEEPTLDIPIMGATATDPTFPWPIADDDAPPGSSTRGIVAAQTWPGLTPAERGVALFVGDGLGGPGTERRLQQALGVTREHLDELLWGLLRKGFLQAVAGWWTR